MENTLSASPTIKKSTWPGISGVDLCNILIKTNPSMKTVVMSGYSPEDVAARTEGVDVAAIIRKPLLSMPAFVRDIHAILHRN